MPDKKECMTNKILNFCDDEHSINNPNCKSGLCGHMFDYPYKCSCGGLIHASWTGEGDSWEIICDKCGKTEDD